jgi:hypothetical protein
MSAAHHVRGSLPFGRRAGLFLVLSVMLPAAQLNSAEKSSRLAEASTSNATPAARGHGQISSTGLSHTYVDLTDEELAKAIHELKHLQPAESQDGLAEILRRTGANVAEFFDNFSNTTCTEHITARLDMPAHVGANFYDTKNQYLALAAEGSLKTHLQEMRTNSKGEPVTLDSWGGVVTIGFVSMAAHFYPEYQRDSRYRLVGRENVHGIDDYVVVFAQRPKVARQTLHANFFDRTAVIYMQGVAWIDPENFQIIRMRTDILHPEDSIGLVSETTDIEYFEVKFENGSKSLWLPRTVKVDGQTFRFSFHNVHTYSNYRLFSVQSEPIPKGH